MLTRRAFLAAAPMLAARAEAARPHLVSPASEPAPAASQLDPWVEVHTQHLRHNVAEVARACGARPILAVIKNNGYGLGLANVARVLDEDPRVAGHAVVKLAEAIALRDAGIRKPVLLMGPFTDPELADAAARDVSLMVYRDHGAAFDASAARLGRPVGVHVKVDTGMGRVGIPYRAAANLVRTLAARKSVRLDGIMTTLTEDEVFDRQQVARLTTLGDELARDGIRVRRHAASSYALFQTPEALLDMVRPGMALFGIYPEPRFRATGRLDLRPALALRCRVALVKRLEPGESAGYNRAFVAKQPTWVATLPVGHADGWPRAAAQGARVRIGGRAYPVVASVSASHTIVDIGSDTALRDPQSAIRPGDVATLFDWVDGSRPEDVSAACGASVYDLTMHLNPLLPRRVV